MFGDDAKAVIRALSHPENALSLQEFADTTKLSLEQVYQILQFLMRVRIFACNNSFVKSEIGEMVYMFASNNEAQAVASAFEEEGS